MQPDTVKGCVSWYVVRKGATCASMLAKFNITIAQLYKWNPSVGNDCRGLKLG